MPVRDTSLTVYFTEVNPSLPARQLQILKVFLRYPNSKFTDKDLCRLTDLPINCVTPRRGELVKLGFIKDAGKVLFTYAEGKTRYVHQYILNR